MFAKKLLSIGVAGALGLLCAPAFAGPVVNNNAVEIVGAGAAADPLIAVEANRAAIINRLVAEHSDTLVDAGISEQVFRNALHSLRADQLLAASLVNSVAEITAIVSQSPSNGSALQRFVALTPTEATSLSQVPSAEAYLVRDGETLTIVKAANMQIGAGAQLVGYFAPTTSVVSASTAAAFTPKDGSGSGAGSWIGRTSGGNQATGLNSAVAAGANNLASAQGAFVGAGTANQANGLSSLVIGGFDNRAVGIDSLVGAGAGHRATGSRSVIVGGGYNLASGGWSFIGGGGRDGTESTPAGTDTRDNIASGNWSVVVGGKGNRATADYAVVPGGSFNTASGNGSVALGQFALTQTAAPVVHNGAFVYSDGSSGNFRSTANNTFNVLATGGMRFVTAAGNSSGEASPSQTISFNPDGTITTTPFEQVINLTSGTKGIGAQANTLYFRANGAGANAFYWYRDGTHSNTAGDPGGGQVLASLTASASTSTVTGTFRAQVITATSDRNQKTAFEALSPKNILAKVAAMPITMWSYKNEAATGVRHIGPVAQDFMRLFNVGYDDKSIATVDADGVAFAAIQGLKQDVDEKNARINKLERDLNLMERELNFIKAKLGMN
jgi:hypothetical protein